MNISKLKNNHLIRNLYNHVNPAGGIILMLHRVVDSQSQIEDNCRLEITKTFLEQTIQFYQQAGYYFVNMDEVLNIHQSNNRVHTPYVCFTFDDGYRDNLTNAFPIFEKYEVPFTLYVATDFPDRKIGLWWYQIENLVMQTDRVLLLNEGEIDCNNMDSKNKAFLQLKHEIKQLPNIKAKDWVQNIFSLNNFRMTNEVALLNWDEIKQLHKSGLCNIGSHGISHTSLVSLTNKDMFYELKESKRILEDVIETEVAHFAYPYGDMNPHVAKAVKQCGYVSAVRIDGGMQRLHQNPFYFKRSLLYQP